jgi:dipeptidyl aminopeptidase/acylaminoacyl peptidase
MPTTPAPYGTWRSPLTADRLATAGRRVADVVCEGSTVYWGETRPSEAGRVTIMRRITDGSITEILSAPMSARSRVHEYGGGAFCVADGVIYFSNFNDNRMYRLVPDATPVPLTAEGRWRYADCVVDRQRSRLIGVREDHTRDGEPRNEVVAIDLATGEVKVLASGHDFYSNPRLSPSGDQLCWLQWDHPNMPWDGTTLCCATVAPDGLLAQPAAIAGGFDESIYCPQWSPDGILHFVSDRTGWWNLYRLRDGTPEALWPLAAEFGVPHWNFGTATFGFDREDIICIYGQPGMWKLARIPAAGGQPHEFHLPYSELGNLRVDDGQALLVAASPTEPPALVSIALASGKATVLRQPSDLTIGPSLVSLPEAITFPTDGGTAHGFYYAPNNPDFLAPSGERPPLIVIGHGGPTSSTSIAFSPAIQFWTSRGFAVLDVNYGGSTGYGRAYRERLNGAWGIRDVADCVNGAKYLVARGDVDGKRLVIRGGSAGGYTTLCALAFHDVFRAGASHYGIGDLEALAKDTHKFEQRYLDRLVGPHPARRDLYIARSPIHHVDKLSCPIIFFQGLEDRVVPPAQAETMVAALRAKGIPVAYVAFEGEQHGFRRAENIQRALEAELYFYGRVLGFTPADNLSPVPIDNLTASAGNRPGGDTR